MLGSDLPRRPPASLRRLVGVMLIWVPALASCAAPGGGVPVLEETASEPASFDPAATGLARDDTIFTESGRTVNFNGQAVVSRVRYTYASTVYDGASRKGDPLDRVMQTTVATVRGVAGPHEDVTLALELPVVSKEMRTEMGGRRVRLEAAGLGDAALIGKWRFYKDPEPGETTEAAAIFGLELPTGQDDARDEGMRLPAGLQPGSGSVDALLGAAFTRLWDGGRWLINADLVYRAHSEANDYRFGNVLRMDIGGQLRVHPVRFERYDQLTLNAVLELNGQYAERDKSGGERVKESGGWKVFLSPGLQAILTDFLLIEGGVQIPVFRYLHGPQLAEDIRTLVGLRWRF